MHASELPSEPIARPTRRRTAGPLTSKSVRRHSGKGQGTAHA